MDERLFWLGFSLCSGIGPAKFQALLGYFDTAGNAWKASEAELVACMGKAAAAIIVNHRKEFSPEDYYAKLQKYNTDFVTQIDSEYPPQLVSIQKSPYVLFTKGNKELLVQIQMDKGLAIVGTRKVTDYGRQVTEDLAEALASSGYIIISGLALGVDAIAHQAALDAGGKTIAVLGCGVDCCNPRENTRLYNEILNKNGLIVSEHSLGVQPNRGTFPARNRIIAGLSVGVVVTEGAEDSGSLITANDAIENNRPVFAVPGPITSSVSRGPISLITKGAKIVMSAEDILKELQSKNNNSTNGNKSIKGSNDQEQHIIDLLQDQSLHFDELVKKTGLSSSDVGTILSLMEMKGMIKPLTSGMYVLA